MGISGLLPLLKDAQEHHHISHFKGKRLAVDAYVWLHKGAFGCAEDLVKGKKTTKFVDYAMYRVRMLKHHGITPYIVFDGGPLPAKKGTEDKRSKSRADNLVKAQAFEAQGKLTRAREFYTKCLDVTPEMAYQLIKALRAEHIDYVVAPYEADAQLCYLERVGLVDGIITEDSDLLVFGCQQVIYKLDNNGQCISIHRDRLASLREFPMSGWTSTEFRRMAMLAGCDYLDSIPGIGIKKAYTLLRRHKTMEKLLQFVRLEGRHDVPFDYASAFNRAELPFMHQRVFCPYEKRLKMLNAREAGRDLTQEDEMWIGLDVSAETARGMAAGDLHPETHLPIDDQWPDYKPEPRRIQPLAGSSKDNLPTARGPMDAFLTILPRAAQPTHIPRPVGADRSGRTSLHEQSLKRVFSPNEPTSGRATMPEKKVRSKFFGGRKARPAEEEVDLVWETAIVSAIQEEAEPTLEPLDVDIQIISSPTQATGRLSSPALRSPSPAVSSLAAATPRKPLRESLEDHAFTSPSSVFSSPSSPWPTAQITSIPPKSPENSARLSRVRGTSELSSLDVEPSVTAIQEEAWCTPTQSTFRDIPSSQLVQASSTPPSARSHRGRDKGHTPLSQLNTNIPPSKRLSGGVKRQAQPRDLQDISSDTIDSDILITPSAQPIEPILDIPSGQRSKGRRPASIKSDELSPEDAEEDSRRAEYAAGISQHWAAKWALKATTLRTPIPFSRAHAGQPALLHAASKPIRMVGEPITATRDSLTIHISSRDKENEVAAHSMSDFQLETRDRMDKKIQRAGEWMTGFEKKVEKKRKREEADVFSPEPEDDDGALLRTGETSRKTGTGLGKRMMPMTSCLNGLQLPVMPSTTGGGLERFKFRGKVRS